MFKRRNPPKPKKSSRPSYPPSSSPTPPHIPTQSNGNSFKDSIISGFGFGIGSNIAHKITDHMFNGNGGKEDGKKIVENNMDIPPITTITTTTTTPTVCDVLKMKLEACVSANNADCTQIYDQFFNDCK